ncbi:proline-tRNA ligase [Sporothrix schenckii ATCC 58251]|uniref:proline--tRNA ligase n=1 Tax=Sporothrix schenckii (strain ATCC 58251 / de Perez 2211183) TaxID=1391915 RepID=U7PZ81_SPOS1|nr:proline-tRNA ligase [Sporothrix schenckii ATCC 58251]
MTLRSAFRPALRPSLRTSTGDICPFAPLTRQAKRWMQLDHRNRLSNIWLPAPQVFLKDAKHDEESHAKLIRAGFFRQAHSGLFHLLPMGFRVQDKIEALVDKHMKAIGGSRVSLSSISSANLWARSGRLQNVQSELFQFADRKDAKYLLSPTHEEEITELVSQNVRSYRGLPLRLYQITRKYRDEMRPRHGILRSREFLMKDMYTFDASVEDAMATYDQVRAAYAAIFAALKVPVLAAQASSGDMGGNLSHEYHLAASLGEDYVAHCSSCDLVANTEVLEATVAPKAAGLEVKYAQAWRGISRDHTTLVNVWYPAEAINAATGETVRMSDDDIDPHAVKAVVPDLHSGIENVAAAWNGVLAKRKTDTEAGTEPASRPKIVNLVDQRLLQSDGSLVAAVDINTRQWPLFGSTTTGHADAITRYFDVGAPTTADSTGRSLNFAKPRTGDDCPRCHGHGTLVVDRAIELGHTFYLGTRYTSPEALDVKIPAEGSGSAGAQATIVPEMGCYGLGISRILGAVADHLADQQGLNWPRAIAPFEVAVIMAPPRPSKAGAAKIPAQAAVAEGVYDILAGRTNASSKDTADAELDVVLDDRNGASLLYKLKDADLMGYPVVVVVGMAWFKSVGTDDFARADSLPLDGLVEVQCRQLGVKTEVPLRDLRAFVAGLLDQL